MKTKTITAINYDLTKSELVACNQALFSLPSSKLVKMTPVDSNWSKEKVYKVLLLNLQLLHMVKVPVKSLTITVGRPKKTEAVTDKPQPKKTQPKEYRAANEDDRAWQQYIRTSPKPKHTATTTVQYRELVVYGQTANYGKEIISRREQMLKQFRGQA